MPDRPKPISIGTSANIRVVRGPREDGRWYWRGERPDGKGGRIKVWVGWGTPEEAEACTIAKLAGVADSQASATGTMRELLGRWSTAMDERGDLSPKTQEHYEDACNRITPILGPLLTERVDRRTLERFRDQRLREGAAASTVRQDLTVIAMAWTWGREVGLCPERDLPSVVVRRRPGERVRSHYTPTDAEARKVLDELMPGPKGTVAGRRPLWYSRAAWLMLATGTRIGEIADLRRRQLVLEQGAGMLRVEKSKTGPRLVPLHNDAVREIASWGLPEHRDARVWGVAPSTVTSRLPVVLREACERANVPHWTPHGFRRHAVDVLYGLDGDPSATGAALGQSAEVAIRTYRQVREGDLRKLMERARLGALGTIEDITDRIHQAGGDDER